MAGQLLHHVKHRLRDEFIARFLRTPRAIQVEITNACNLRCVMCPSNSPEAEGYTRKRTLIDFGLYREIIDQATQFDRCHIIPQGGGEPFLHPRFREMLVLAKSRPNLTVGFVTNGTKANPDDPGFLVDLGIEEVVVSVYGHDAAGHLATTGRDSYPSVEAFIVGLAEAKARRRSALPRIRVQTVDITAMREGREGFVKRWLRWANEVAILSQRDLTGRGLDGDLRTKQPKACLKLWREAAISSDGDMTLCCEDWNIDHAIGNVRQRPIWEMWFGHELRQIRERHRAGDFAGLSPCEQCYMIWEAPPRAGTEFGFSALQSQSATVYRKDL